MQMRADRWRRLPPGPVPGYLLGDPWPGREERAEALRLSLPDPSEAGEEGEGPDPLIP